MASSSRLRDVLIKALSNPENHDEQELFNELMVQKQSLLKIFNVGSRDSHEQREIESGKTVINGRQVAVNSDFARQVLFLAQQLNCSERYLARVLHNVMEENPNIGPVNCIEAAVASVHQERRHLVDSLRYLLEAAEAAERPDASFTYDRVRKYVLSELLPSAPGQPKENTMGLRVWKEIEALDSVITRADAARKNAGSNTVAPTDRSNPTLGYDVLNARYDSLRYERRYLAVCLTIIARLGLLSPDEVKLVAEWLSTNSNHPMSPYFLTTILLVFDPVDPSSAKGLIRQALATNPSLMTFMSKKLSPGAEWKEQGLKAVVLLSWTMFLTDARHNDATLENRAGFKAEELETQVWNAVQGDAFSYLGIAVMQMQRNQNGRMPAVSLLNSVMPELPEQKEIVPDDFRQTYLFTLETLIRSLIMHASSELRKIKQRQEDLVLASVRERSRTVSARFVPNLGQDTDKPEPAPRHDIAMLYSFIGLLYSVLPPERALQFWGSGPQSDASVLTYLEYLESNSGRLPGFLQWAVWSTPVQDLTMLTALYDMLSGLSNGQQCSELAYNFMARGGGEIITSNGLASSSSGGPSVSWSVIFSLLESWAVSSASSRGQVQSQSLGLNPAFSSMFTQFAPPQPQPSQSIIGPKDVLLAQAFLRLLSTVVTHSVAVRVAISGHAHFRAIPTLVSLIPLGIPLELKGALFDTLAAFCEPGAGTPGVEICKAVWVLMERLEVINVRGGSMSGFNAATGKGVELELEQIETVHRQYPATIPFLRLLGTLIHTPKRIPIRERIVDAEPINTIPETLGQPYRLPGIGPFTAFVVDNVFANIPNREYVNPSDRWQINDLCLCFIERALASFNLESLISSPEDAPLRGDALVPLLVHPGYELLKRMLTNSPLQASILSYLVEGVEGFEKEFADEEPFFRNTIVHVLRIVHRVLDIQDIFLDVLIPLLGEFDSAPIVGTVHSRSFFIKFDQALSFGPQYIPALAAYMAYPTHAELVLLSVKILTILSATISYSTLVTLIERSNDSNRILTGFVQIMSSESMDDVAQAEENAERTTGAGAPDTDTSEESFDQAIRVAALNLLIQETNPIRPYPNIGHFLLFGASKHDHQIQDPHALGARLTSVHILLALVNGGVPRLKEKRRERERNSGQTIPLFLSLPALAERCYHVIHQLSTHPRTSEFTTRYLRTRENFFARQLAAIPSVVPEILEKPHITVLYKDGSTVATTVSTLSSFVRLRSFIFDLVALELHVLTHKGHYKGVTELLEIMFGSDVAHEDENGFQVFHEVGQSQMRIINFFQSLMFDWSDSLVVDPLQLHFFGQLNLQSCVRRDATGCEIVDRTALMALLAAGRRNLQTQGAIVTPAHVDQLTKEVTYILESCAVENHRRKIAHAVVGGFEAWRRLLDMALTKCFDRLPHDRRENMLFDLLHFLPGAIRSPNVEESTGVLLSETVLSAITKLREDRRHQIILQSVGGDSESGALPAERLYGILRNILESILDNNHVELVRGNLYASLINFVHLISSSHNDNILDDSQLLNFSSSLSSSFMRESLSVGRSSSVAPIHHAQKSNSTTALEAGSLGVMKSVIERLIATIARDAIDGTEVWKTVAYMLLDALVQLSGQEKQHIVQVALNRHGILSNFVRGIKESDERLQSILTPDPDDLNPLYVYESKMSLFVRMSQTRLGCERLLEAQLIPILAQCDYLDARPEADLTFMDQDSFLPPAVHRYHQLFMPALQVVDGIVAVLGSKHTTATNQALNFLNSHDATITILLKNDADYVSLGLLDEIHLIVTLCANVLPTAPKTELLSANSGIGSVHSAILALAARCLGRGRAFQHIFPQTDIEKQQASTYAFGFGSETKFDVSVRRKEQLLRKSLVAYVGTSSEFTEPEITLVLSPITTSQRRAEAGSVFPVTIPSVGDSLEALDDLCSELAQTLKQIADLGAELSNREHISVDNVHEVLRDLHTTLLQDLDTEQKRSLVCKEFERIRLELRQEARVLLETVEMLLLVIWRHLDYYAEPRHMNKPPAKTSLANAMRLLATAQPEVFRDDVAVRIAPSLQKLANLDAESLGRDWGSDHAYVEIMCRRLRDSAGLLDEGVERE